MDDFLESLTEITKKNDQIAAFSEFLEGLEGFDCCLIDNVVCC